MGIKTLYIKAPQYENVNNCSLGNGVSFFRGVDVLWQCFFACYGMTCVAQFIGEEWNWWDIEIAPYGISSNAILSHEE